ncbi:MAG: hypothetical protein K6T30_02595 [Alicyclobacillus sp.]|nr:hypothetical protein [Alicyclobacillus sp.]
MWIQWLILVSAISFGTYVEVRNLARKGQTREAWTYGVLMGLAAVVVSCQVLGMPLPSPISPMEVAYESLGKKLLQQ